MFDPSELPADEQEALRREIHALYLQRGGEDIDRAIRRDRKVVVEHEREVDYVSTLPFDQHYRWRIAPSVGLRAQKDLERQQKRRTELMEECATRVLREHGHAVEAKASTVPAKPDAGVATQIAQLDAFIAEAMGALDNWKQERSEASPPVEAAAA